MHGSGQRAKMSRSFRHGLAGLVLIMASTLASAEPHEDREAWKAKIADTRARIAQSRREALAEFQRLKAERLQNLPSSDRESDNENSDAVFNDPDLRYGDIVSTIDGMFMFVGRSGTERTAADFRLISPRFKR